MDTFFTGTGNLGADPELREAPSKDGTTNVVNMRVYFDRQRKGENGYQDDGGFWADVAYFGNKLPVQLNEMLKSGARVFVIGEQRVEPYEHDGEKRQQIKINATYVGIDPLCIESIEFKKAKVKQDKAA